MPTPGAAIPRHSPASPAPPLPGVLSLPYAAHDAGRCARCWTGSCARDPRSPCCDFPRIPLGVQSHSSSAQGSPAPGVGRRAVPPHLSPPPSCGLPRGRAPGCLRARLEQGRIARDTESGRNQELPPAPTSSASPPCRPRDHKAQVNLHVRLIPQDAGLVGGALEGGDRSQGCLPAPGARPRVTATDVQGLCPHVPLEEETEAQSRQGTGPALHPPQPCGPGLLPSPV